MQRVDEDEAGAELAPAPGGQGAQIVQVAHAPGAGRPHRVDLRHEAPLARAGDGLGVESVRRDDQGRGLPQALGLGDDLVPAQWQVAGNREARLAHEDAVDLDGLDPVVHLPERAALPVLRLHPGVHRAAVRDVHPQPAVLALSGDVDGRQHAAPVAQPDLLAGCRDGLAAGDVEPQGAQHGRDRGRADVDVVAGLVPVLGGHAIRGREPAEIVRDRGPLGHLRDAHQTSGRRPAHGRARSS